MVADVDEQGEAIPPWRSRLKGPLAWMAGNAVAANLLMFTIFFGGLLSLLNVKQEVFPQFELDMVLINVAYPGASPAEVEQGVLLAVEEAVREVDGVKEVSSTALEGTGVVVVELTLGTDSSRALADVKGAVDRITSFPQDVERPIVSLASNRREVITLVVYGDQEEKALRHLAEDMRDGLLASDDITVVELGAVRPLEVSIEVPQAELRRYGLTLEQVSQLVRRASVELPGGGVKTPSGEILVRTAERRRSRDEFAQIAILSRPDGSEIRLGQIAEIDDGFRETDQSASFDGLQAAMIRVFRVGDETPVAVAQAVKDYEQRAAARLPAGVRVSTWSDWSEMYQQRLKLLTDNAKMGLVLVLIVLALFLEVRLAFWVTLGIPISFVGALAFLPPLDASVNMISLFAFIVTLGMVVDDAIVVGEAIYHKRSEGLRGLDAAVAGIKEVAVPVVFAILTTLVAFAPMLFVPGAMGKFFRLIPIVVMAVLSISLIESLLILPAHLAHSKTGGRGILGFIDRYQERFSAGVERFIIGSFGPFLRRALDYRYLVIALGICALLLSAGLVAGGRVNFTFMPKVEGDVVVADVALPFGAPVEDTHEVIDRLVHSAQGLLEEMGGQDEVSRGVFAQVGNTGFFAGGARPTAARGGGGHVGEVAVYLVPLGERAFTSSEFSARWRQRVGEIPGLEHLKFNYNIGGPSAGAPVDVELSHTDVAVLEEAATELAEALQGYAGVFDIDDGFSAGKQQLDFKLRPEARALGLTELELARQVRASFFGSEAVREQRGREELRVFVRLPQSERHSEFDVESLLLQTPGGGEIPLADAATVARGRSFTEIKRREGRRVVNVSADVDNSITNAGKVLADVKREIIPRLISRYRGLGVSLEGEQAAQREALGALGIGFLFALFGIYALLAVVFRSYAQPLIIMLVIPFGLVGALLGHLAMSYSLSLMSMMGIVALSGVVVNDSLILIVAINEFRSVASDGLEAITLGAVRRFRPILLTSLTTFLGLVPMILETSAQARFLIPMAISLGFGVLFATVICLLLVPAVYAAMLDLLSVWRRLSGAYRRAGDRGGLETGGA